MNKRKACKWYSICPIKHYTDKKKLDKKWVKNYCLVGNKDCIRYKLEEQGKYQPNNMLPDGSINKNLK